MEKREEYNELKVPAYALSYLVNGDASGLEEEDVKAIDSWYKWYANRAKELSGSVIFNTMESEFEEYFSPSPEFGLPCTVVDCIILIVS